MAVTDPIVAQIQQRALALGGAGGNADQIVQAGAQAAAPYEAAYSADARDLAVAQAALQQSPGAGAGVPQDQYSIAFDPQTNTFIANTDQGPIQIGQDLQGLHALSTLDASRLRPLDINALRQRGYRGATQQQIQALVQDATQNPEGSFWGHAGTALEQVGAQTAGGLARAAANVFTPPQYTDAVRQALPQGAQAAIQQLGAIPRAIAGSLNQFADYADRAAQGVTADYAKGESLRQQAGDQAGALSGAGLRNAAGDIVGGFLPTAALALVPGVGQTLAGAQLVAAGGEGTRTSAVDRVSRQLNGMSDQELQQSNSDYAALRRSGLAPDAAKQALVSRAGDAAFEVGGMLSAATLPLADLGLTGVGRYLPRTLPGFQPESALGRALVGQAYFTGAPTRALIRGTEGALLTTAPQVGADVAGQLAAGQSPQWGDYGDSALHAAVGQGLLGALLPGVHPTPTAVTEGSDIGAAAAGLDAGAGDAAAQAQAQAFQQAQPGQTPDLFGAPPSTEPQGGVAPAPQPRPQDQPIVPPQPAQVPDNQPGLPLMRGQLLRQRLAERNGQVPGPQQPDVPAALPAPPSDAERLQQLQAQRDQWADHLTNVQAQLEQAQQGNKRSPRQRQLIQVLQTTADDLQARLQEADNQLAGEQIGQAREAAQAQEPLPPGASVAGDPTSGQLELPGVQPVAERPAQLPTPEPEAAPQDRMPDGRPAGVTPAPVENSIPMSPQEAQSRLQQIRARRADRQAPQRDMFPSQEAAALQDIIRRAQGPEERAPSTPEPREDLEAQVQNMLDPASDRDAVLVTPGNQDAVEALRDQLPDNVKVVERPEGTLLTTNAAKATRFRRKKVLTDADLAQLQGLPETNAEAVSTGRARIVQARDSEGRVAAEAVSSGPNDAVVAGRTPAGGRTVVLSPAEGQARRAARRRAEPVPEEPVSPEVEAPRARALRDKAATRRRAAAAADEDRRPAEPITAEEGEPSGDMDARQRAAEDALLARYREEAPDQAPPVREARSSGRRPDSPLTRLALLPSELRRLAARIHATAHAEVLAMRDGTWSPRTSQLRGILGELGARVEDAAALKRTVGTVARAGADEVRRLVSQHAGNLAHSTVAKGIVRGIAEVRHATPDTRTGTDLSLGPDGRHPAAVDYEPEEVRRVGNVALFGRHALARAPELVDSWNRLLERDGVSMGPIEIMTPGEALARHPQLGRDVPTGPVHGFRADLPDGRTVIAVDFEHFRGAPEAALETLAHEYGHQVTRRIFEQLPAEEQAPVREAYERWRQLTRDLPDADVARSRRPGALAGRIAEGSRYADPEYLRGFNEWAADNVARWLTTAREPRTALERFFARVAASLKQIYQSLTGGSRPDQAWQDFLDSWVDSGRDVRAADEAARAVDLSEPPAAEPVPASERVQVRAAGERLAQKFGEAASSIKSNVVEPLVSLAVGDRSKLQDTLGQLRGTRGEQLVRQAVLNVSTMRDLVRRFGGKGLFGSGLKRWVDANVAKTTAANRAREPGARALSDALALTGPMRQALERVMYEATTNGVAADVGFDHARNRHLTVADEATTRLNQERWGRVSALYRQLSPEAQRTYVALREALRKLDDDTVAERIEQIKNLDGLSEEARAEAVAREEAASRLRREGDYFPLTRDGDWVTTVLSPSELRLDEGDVPFYSRASAERAARQIKAANPHAQVSIEALHERGAENHEYGVRVLERATYFHQSEREANLARPQIEAEMRQAYKDAGFEGQFDPKFIAPPKMKLSFYEDMARVPGDSKFLQDINRLEAAGKMDPAAANALRNRYIESLPEFASRKSTLRRENIRGASSKMLAGYARRLSSSAHYFAAVKHMPDINRGWADMVKARDATDENRFREAGEILNYLRYHQQVLAKRTNLNGIGRVLGAVADASSFMSLGFSPAYAIINSTQPLMTTLPMLAALSDRAGNAVGAAEAARYLREAYGTQGAAFFLKRGLTDTLNQFRRAAGQHAVGDTQAQAATELFRQFARTQGERDMLQYLYERGSLDFAMLNSVEDAVSASAAGRTLRALHHASMAIPQSVETMNRVVSALAAMRVAREKLGMTDPDEIHAFVDNLVAQSQGDYSRFNRPAIANTALGNLAFQFKIYTQNIYSLLVQNFARAVNVKGAYTKAQQREAWRTLRNVLGMHAAIGGLNGLGPIYWAAKGGIALALAAGGATGLVDRKDSEWKDTDAVLRSLYRSLGREVFGDDAANITAAVMERGLTRLLGIDLSDRVGIPLVADARFANTSPRDTAGETLQKYALLAMGAPVSNGIRAANGLQALLQGDLGRFATQVLPSGPRSVLRGVQLAREGLVDTHGNPVDASEKVSNWDIAQQMFGFQPGSVVDAYEARSERNDTRERISLARQTLLDQAVQAQTPEERAELRKRISEFNESVPPGLAIKSSDVMSASRRKAQAQSGQLRRQDAAVQAYLDGD